jgi:hypothetical protein
MWNTLVSQYWIVGKRWSSWVHGPAAAGQVIDGPSLPLARDRALEAELVQCRAGVTETASFDMISGQEFPGDSSCDSVQRCSSA